MTGPYEPEKIDSEGTIIPHEERDWPTEPPSEREPRWAYHVTRERERTLRNAYTTRHDAVGVAAMFNAHFDESPFHVVARRSSGPMFWETDAENECDWCGFVTTIRPLVGWVFVVAEDHDGKAFCSDECHDRWVESEGGSA